MVLTHAKAIFIGGALISSITFAVLTFDTQRKFAQSTHEEKLTGEVAAGKWVWQKYNCNDCHTILGIGGYYAPDLTKILKSRDVEWLKNFIADPAKVWPQERKMPNLHLSGKEISEVIAFLTWVNEIDTSGWPPRPLVGSPTALPGEALFRENGCSACHTIGGIGGKVGPDLTRVGSRRQKSWIMDQIRTPQMHYPQSIMPSFAKLPAQDIEELADYLSSLK